MIEGIIENPREIFRNGCYESLLKAYENKQYKIFSSIKEWKEFVLYTWSPDMENVRIVPFIAPAKNDGKIIFDDFTVSLEENK